MVHKKSHVITLYISLSQTSDELQSFISHLEKLLIDTNSFDPHFVKLLGDFNAKSLPVRNFSNSCLSEFLTVEVTIGTQKEPRYHFIYFS